MLALDTGCAEKVGHLPRRSRA